MNMTTRFNRLSFLATLTLVALGLGLVGCAWGTVTDSNTKAPIVGAEVTFQDSNGNTGTTTTGAGGLYAFDATKGQAIPAVGSTTYTISAPGYDAITVQRNVAYNDNQSAIWEIQGFALTRTGEEPPPVQAGQLAIDVDRFTSGIQTSGAVSISTPFSVDIVLVDPPAPLGAFDFSLLYDDNIIRATELPDTPGDSLDDNPDANQAALGGGWDCSILDLRYPTGDTNPETGPQAGEARISCWSLTGPYQFADTGVIASVNFVPVSPGSTWLDLANVVLGGTDGVEMGSCNPVSSVEMTCGSASITVQ
jgi:Carboxypeptidase regulatory-like domain